MYAADLAEASESKNLSPIWDCEKCFQASRSQQLHLKPPTSSRLILSQVGSLCLKQSVFVVLSVDMCVSWWRRSIASVAGVAPAKHWDSANRIDFSDALKHTVCKSDLRESKGYKLHRKLS